MMSESLPERNTAPLRCTTSKIFCLRGKGHRSEQQMFLSQSEPDPRIPLHARPDFTWISST